MKDERGTMDGRHLIFRASFIIPHSSFLSFSLLLALLGCFAASASAQICTTPGRDDVGGTISGVVNTYYPGAASASVGATSVLVGTPASGTAPAIAAGDLLLVIQMQDATINSSNTSSYGNGASGGAASGATSIGNSGLYEYVIATSAVSGGSVTIRGARAGGGLVNSYTNADATSTQGARRFQVVRVPQYSSATLSSGLTALAWNGRTGGILAVDVGGNLNLGGAIVNLDGFGFRGGGARALDGGSGGANNDVRNLSTLNFHGQKGEGIAGTPRYVYDATLGIVTDTGAEGYPNGSSANGAPANAGGGGTDGNISSNDQNSGGGGGGNAGAGGRGGNTWSSDLARGGWGGSGITSSAARVIMGGGGGAGSRNNSSGVMSSGGAGGGLVIIRANTVSGTGTISADGVSGIEPQNDGGSGGGAGGSIIVAAASGGLGALTARARGARGTNADLLAGSSGQAHGPGGGGGGGFIALSGAATISVTGGANGTTSAGAGAYGSTSGANGASLTIALNDLTGARTAAQCYPSLTVTKTTSTPTVVNTGTATYTITATNLAGRGTAQSLSISDVLPASFTYASAGAVTLNGGALRTATVNPTAGASVPAFGTFEIPGGGSIALTFTTNVNTATAPGVYQNPATATYSDPARTISTGTIVADYNSASSTGEDVTVTGAPPSIALVKSVTPGGTQTPGTDLTYTIDFTNSGGSSAANFQLVDPDPASALRLDTDTDFKLGSATAALGTTGLTLVVEYSNDNRATWSYTPVSGAGGAPAGYDRTVTHLRWRFTGTLSQTSPNNTGSVSFVVRIR